MVRGAAFGAALLITLAGVWLSFFGVEYLMSLLPQLHGSGHRYIRWIPITVSFFPWFIIFATSREQKAAPPEGERLTPLPPRSQRPL